MKHASNELKLFFKSYLEWALEAAEMGKPSPKYNEWFGICAALDRYQGDVPHSVLHREMEMLFNYYCSDTSYPFGRSEYHTFKNKMHLDENRLNFCRDAISDSLEVGKYTPKDRLPTKGEMTNETI